MRERGETEGDINRALGHKVYIEALANLRLTPQMKTRRLLA